jgi:hypothetical protein
MATVTVTMTMPVKPREMLTCPPLEPKRASDSDINCDDSSYPPPWKSMLELTNRVGEYSSVSSSSLEAEEECDDGWHAPTAVATPCVIDTSSFDCFGAFHKAHGPPMAAPAVVDSKAQEPPRPPLPWLSLPLLSLYQLPPPLTRHLPRRHMATLPRASTMWPPRPMMLRFQFICGTSEYLGPRASLLAIKPDPHWSCGEAVYGVGRSAPPALCAPT